MFGYMYLSDSHALESCMVFRAVLHADLKIKCVPFLFSAQPVKFHPLGQILEEYYQMTLNFFNCLVL